MLNLNQNVGAICNDGSVASYYVEQGDYTAGQTIMVYLEVSCLFCSFPHHHYLEVRLNVTVLMGS